MNIRRSINRHTGLAAAASAVTAAGLAVVPVQAAHAEPEVSATASVSNGTLAINGTNAADDIQVSVGADPGTLLVDLGNQNVLSFARSTFRTISVALGTGDDSFSVAATRGDVTEPLTISGGNGNDKLLGGAGNDLIFGGNGTDFVDGARGTDTEILDNGDDTAAWDPGEGSDIVDGGRGADTLVFNGSAGAEKFALVANGSGDVFTRDLGTIRMDLSRVENLDLATLAGADTVTLHDVQGTDLTHAAIDLAVNGSADGQADNIVVEGTDGADHVNVNADGSAVDVTGLPLTTQPTGSNGLDHLQVNTGAGNDAVDVSDAAAALLGVAVDLGADQT